MRSRQKISEWATAIAKMEHLRMKISQKLRGKPKAESALAAVEKQGSQAELGRVAAIANSQ